MRVAIFTESYEPIVNGVSVSVATLRDGLRARGHEVFVFAPRFPGHEDDESTFRFPSRITRFDRGYPLPIPYSPRIRREFRRIRPDVVHTHTPFLLGITGLRWARTDRVPIISTNHTLYTEYAHYCPVRPKLVTRAALIGLMRWYYNRCDGVVTPSGAIEQVLRGYGVRSEIEIIGSGISLTRSSAGRHARASFGIPDDAFLLLYVGRVAREKNLGLLLRAFKLVRQTCGNARLMIVGGGPYSDACKRMAAELGIGDSVIFTGMLSRTEVDQVYGVADLFAFPSMTETQGLVVCEALAAGLPCVAVRAAATPEVLADGLDSILTKNSVEEFAEAISTIVWAPELRVRLSEGARRNSARFSVEAMTEHFEQFYQSAINRSTGKLVTVGG